MIFISSFNVHGHINVEVTDNRLHLVFLSSWSHSTPIYSCCKWSQGIKWTFQGTAGWDRTWDNCGLSDVRLWDWDLFMPQRYTLTCAGTYAPKGHKHLLLNTILSSHVHTYTYTWVYTYIQQMSNNCESGIVSTNVSHISWN